MINRPSKAVLALAAGLAAFAATSATALAESPMVKSGTISIDQTQFGLIISGQSGGGTLEYKGKSYPFTIGGLGLGSVGVSNIKAYGTVYDLHKLSDFAGVYGALSTGVAAGNSGEGQIMLRNDKGVSLRLETREKGLALTAGGSGVNISLK